MSSLRLIDCALIAAVSLVGCIEYKAEPEDGKQACATGPAGTKRCPDDYHCNDQDQRCYKNAANAPGGAGGGAGGTSGARSATSAMLCSLASDIPCNITISKCCNSFECKYVVGSLEYPCSGFNCASAAESARTNCTSGSGGATGGTSGSKATGGSSGAVTGAGDTVTFRYGQASGLPMSGFGWIALGSKDVLTDPTCGDYKERITQSLPCMSVTNWNSTSALCISGTIPALPVSPVQADYDENWGIQIGVNVTEPPTGTLNRSYSTISVNISNAPTWGFRIEIHRQGDPDGTLYCYDGAVTGKVVPLRLFNTKCWGGDPTTVSLLDSDIPNIDKIGVQVSSMSSAITLSNMCLNSITLGK